MHAQSLALHEFVYDCMPVGFLQLTTNFLHFHNNLTCTKLLRTCREGGFVTLGTEK